MAAKFKYLGGYPGRTKSTWGTFSSRKNDIIFETKVGGLRFPYKDIVNIQLEKADNPNVSAILATGFIGLVWKNKVLVISFLDDNSLSCNAAFQEKSTEITGQMMRLYNNLIEGWHKYLSQTGTKPAVMPSGGGVVSMQGGSVFDTDTKKCPYCAEFVKKEAVRCKHCGADLDASDAALERMQSEKQQKQIVAAQSLSVESLIRRLYDEDEDVRNATIVALGERGESAVEPLIFFLNREDEDVDFRLAVGQALGEIGEPAIDSLIMALQEEDTRFIAAEALGTIGDPVAVEPLLMALEDEDGDVRCAAAAALGEIGDPAAVESLREALAEDEYEDVRYWAAVALGETGDTVAVESLIAALGEDKNEDVRRAAAEALGAIGDPIALESLTSAGEDDSELVCKTAELASQRINDIEPTQQQPEQTAQEPEQETLHAPAAPDTKECPFCAETIKAKAIVCRYCNRDLVQQVQASNVKLSRIITHEIMIDGIIAFSKGEEVSIESVSPDPTRPEYKYVVFSKLLNKRFRLSDTDVSQQ
jgi:HEAT repeat protein